MLRKNNTSALTLLLLLAFTAVPKSLEAAGKPNFSIAQGSSTVSPSPSAAIPVPTDAKIEIDGSTSMRNINQVLKERFEQKFPGARVNVNYDGSEAAVKDVEAGKLDLSAIGRNLTEAEKAKGLKEAPISRNKIALIVSVDNPFNGSLTIEQFAQIFRGEIKNWSQVGGVSAPVRFIDRPETSDTRQAFPNYTVFQKNFKTGATAVTLKEDTTEAVIAKLGKDGIGYAIADQVVNNPKVKVLKMHDILPDNPKYPFSQALVYIYKGPQPTAAVAAFLGYATAAENQEVIEEARKVGVGGVSPSVTVSPETALVPPSPIPEPEANPSGGFPSWLWLLLLPLAGLLFFLFKGRDSQSEPLTPAEDDNIPVTGAGLTGAAVGSLPENVGAVAAGGVATVAGATGLSSLVGHSTPVGKPNRIILVARGSEAADAEWEVSETDKAARRQEGGEQLTLRIHDATNLNLDEQPPHDTQEYPCDEFDQNKRVSIPVSDRDYVAELGYLTADNRWLSLVRSLHVHIPPVESVPNRVEETLESGKSAIARGAETLQEAGETAREFSSNLLENAMETGSAAIAGGAAAVAGIGATAHSFITDKLTPPESNNRIVLVPRSPQEAYVYWEISPEAKEALRREGGERLTLRLYDMTTLDAEGKPNNSWQYDCEEIDQNKYVPIRFSDHNYVAELGYLTAEGRWLSLAKSDVVYVPVV